MMKSDLNELISIKYHHHSSSSIVYLHNRNDHQLE